MRRIRALVLLALCMTAALAGLWVWLVPPIDRELAGLEHWRPPSSCEVFDAEGRRIDQWASERRVWVPLEELPPVVWQAVLAAEDQRFFSHPGVDMVGIVRAAGVNLWAGSIQEGGSTLTQQLVKNLLVGDAPSLERKAREALMAWRLEQRLGKRQLLELYLSYVYLGEGNYGVEAAAQDYFGVSARRLSAGQAALLAGLISAPSRLSPRRAPGAAAAQRDRVLRAMVEMDTLSPAEALRWQGTPISLAERSPPPALSAAYLTEVRRAVRALVDDEECAAIGLQVHTAFHPGVQAAAEQAIRGAVAAVLERQGLARPARRLTDGQLIGWLAIGAPTPTPGSCFEAAVLDGGALAVGAWRGELSKAAWRQPVRTPGAAVPETLGAIIAPGDLLPVCMDEAGALWHAPASWVDGAAVVVDNRTGQVVAMVGGVDAELEGFNKATQARRQPGSSFKPYVYAAALQAGVSPHDTIVDAPLSLRNPDGSVWTPRNYGRGYAGRMRVWRALAWSVNTAAVRLARRVGPAAVISVAQAAGVTAPLRADLSIALGTSEVSVLDQATGYSTFARLGVHIPPGTITRLRDRDGRLLGQAGGPVTIDGVVTGYLPGGPGKQAIAAPVAHALLGMLQQVISHGTGSKAHYAERARAGKTGTTDDFVDAWFVGMIPDYTVAVWIGADDRDGLGRSEAGSRAALPAWLAIIEALERPGAVFPSP